MTDQERETVFKAFLIISKNPEDRQLREIHYKNMEWVKENGFLEEYYSLFIEDLQKEQKEKIINGANRGRNKGIN